MSARFASGRASPGALASGSCGPTPDLTPFVGRTRELDGIRIALGERRLVTLTGLGGTGKTRLAGEVARRLGETLPVTFVELASIGDGAFLAARVATALGIEDDLNDPERLAAAIPSGPRLLVLDNCEHLVDAAVRLVSTLLAAKPELRILATSRVELGLPGERVWPLGPLPHEGCGSDAVRLFVELGRDVAPDFELDEESGPVVGAICDRLEGMPLALELAAARLKVLTPTQILERLEDMHALLGDRGRAGDARRTGLRSTLLWSYEHLDADAQRVFRSLSVFRGGFTLAAVEAVGAGGALDLLEQLVDRSLVTMRPTDGETRYSVLEPLRQLGAAELERLPDEKAAACRAHAEHMLALFTEAEPHFLTSQRRRWTARLGPDIDNLRAALTRTSDVDPDLHVRLAAKAWWFWFSTRHWMEARRWLETVARMDDTHVDPATRARLEFALGALDALQARPDDAHRRLARALEIMRGLGDEQATAYALSYLGMAYAQQGKSEAFEVLEEAKRLFERRQDLYGLRLSLLLLGTAMGTEGDFGRAIETAERGVEVARVFGQDRELAVALQTLGGLYLRKGEDQRAEALFLESLRALLRDPADMFTARALHLTGVLRGRRQDAVGAGHLIGLAETLRRRIGAPPFELDRTLIDVEVARLRAGPDHAAFEQARANASRLDVDEAVRAMCEPPAPEVPATGAPTGAPTDHPPARRPPARPNEVAPAAVADLEIRALGPVEVVVRGCRLDDDAWSYAKPRELLVFLAAHPAGRTRDEIAASLWPDTEPERLKNSFHVTLHHLRKTLGDPGWVVIERDVYRIPADRSVVLDVHRFEAAIDRLPITPTSEADMAAYAEALAIYRGDFMAGNHGVRWHEPVADRVRARFAEATLRLAGALETTGRHDDATEAYRRAVVFDDLNEEAHRGLMRSLARAGQRGQALRHFDRLSSLLEREIGARPEPETLELRDQLRESAELGV